MSVETPERIGSQSTRILRTANSSVTYIDGWRERALRGIGIPVDSDTVSYILLGIAAENYPGDVLAIYLKRLQLPDGRWFIRAHRPPLESNDIANTAACMRTIRVTGPKHGEPNLRRRFNRPPPG